MTHGQITARGMAASPTVATETIRLRTSRMGSTTQVTDTLAGGNAFVTGNAGRLVTPNPGGNGITDPITRTPDWTAPHTRKHLNASIAAAIP